ncbi:VOC family protein, partial [Micromonospora azadirachtae]
AEPRPRPAEDDFAVYVAIDDVNAHYARARAAGAEIIREPFDTDYGSRDYAARDLAGNVWSFGTYRA